MKTGEVMVFTGPQFVLTVRHGPADPTSEAARRLNEDAHMLRFGPVAVLRAVLDTVVDSYTDAAAQVRADLTILVRRVFSPVAGVEQLVQRADFGVGAVQVVGDVAKVRQRFLGPPRMRAGEVLHHTTGTRGCTASRNSRPSRLDRVYAHRDLTVGLLAQRPAVLTLLANSSGHHGQRLGGAIIEVTSRGDDVHEVMAMSLRAHEPLPVPDLTAQVARAAFQDGCLGMRLRDALGPVFRDEDFADLFPRRGRPALSPGQLALVCVLQFVEGLSERQAATAVRERIGWKYALSLELTDPGFDFSVLCEFRARLIAGKAERRVFDRLLK
ncbi:transposase, partial [Streptomyces avermitilis]|uniref:transposase n=1 Tax=Streptomyces avermitilis TaxID=33903 RepID=UPI0036875EB5